MLELHRISKKYKTSVKNFIALDDISLRVEKGEFVAVVGPSGSGKSTLLHTIGGLIQPDTGQVLFYGSDIYSMTSSEGDRYRRKNVGFVFQQFHLMPYLTIYENILLVYPKSSDKSYIDNLLDKCSLIPLKNKYPSELSVGEKQRAAFIRAIISRPDLLLADEPTGNLDPENSRILMSLIKEFQTDGGTVLMVSHNPDLSKYSNRQIALNSGKLV